VPAGVAVVPVRVEYKGARVVLGPIVGRVTRGTAVVLVELAGEAALGCVLTDSLTGAQHRQVRILQPARPHAFYFDTLETHRHYTIKLEGVVNALARTGAFTTLSAWIDHRAPLALLSAEQGRPQAQGDGTQIHQGGGGNSAECNFNLLFVSATGLPNSLPFNGNQSSSLKKGSSCSGKEIDRRGGMDMWRELSLELWKPWPHADVVVHTGSQVDLTVAVREALPLLSIAGEEEEGSQGRIEAEEQAMEQIRNAYRFQWSLPACRAFLSRGSHLMAPGEGDLSLPSLLSPTFNHDISMTEMEMKGQRPVISAYARVTLSRMISRAYRDYQRQLWSPQSIPPGIDMNDSGYIQGGAGVDSPEQWDCGEEVRAGWARRGGLGGEAGGGEWHFHAFGEIVGLFVMDMWGGGRCLQ
ncbi:unnamed protein product, partial [Choristocarpus tenellus]